MSTKVPASPLTDLSPMPFGKYQGTPLIKVPAHYLLWLFNAGCNNQQVNHYISANLDALKKEAGVR
jgi:uncharacterized protein (DUF3820 family)